MLRPPARYILGVSNVYPSPDRPSEGTFVSELYRALTDHGAGVVGVAPRSLWRAIHSRVLGSSNGAPPGEAWAMVRPKYPTYSRILPLGHFGHRLSLEAFRTAVCSEAELLANGADCILAYFIASAWAVMPLARRHGLPVVVEVGESDLTYYDRVLGTRVVGDTVRECRCVVAVSEQNASECRRRCPESLDRVRHVPNGVDTGLFRPRPKEEARRELGLREDLQLVVFVGPFVERKGPQRVIQALGFIDDCYAAFLGTGPQAPAGPKVVHAGPVSNREIAAWLCAADVFVLPSLAEGMSVAVLEALACGCPLVVSDRPFNRSFLLGDCAVFVEPTKPDDIARGLLQILTDPGRARAMREAARRRSAAFSLDARVHKVAQFAAECGVPGWESLV